jgi:hypothetical protein
VGKREEKKRKDRRQKTTEGKEWEIGSRRKLGAKRNG